MDSEQGHIMSTATTQPRRSEHRSAREIHDDIRETRDEMDATLEELGERLHPRHLLDDLIDLFRGSGESGRSQQAAHALQRAGRSTARAVREHPLPSLLIGAGVAWWVFDEYAQDDEPDWEALGEYSSPRQTSAGADSWDPAYADPVWRQDAMPWHETYQWQEESEEDWSDRARRTMNEIQEGLGDSSRSAHERLKLAAGKMMSISGHKRREIHSRWAHLREHSGSFVDARTGEPYDKSYGQDWNNLITVDAVASAASSSGEEAGDDEQAATALQRLQESVVDTGSSVKDAARRSLDVLASYGRSTGTSLKSAGSSVADAGARWSRATGEGLASAGRATGRSARSMGRSARRGAVQAQEQMSRGYQSARDATTEAMDEYPLAVGAACFGLGLLGGLLLPRTRYEDDLMGEAADNVRSEAQHLAEEAWHAGQDIASATASEAAHEAERQGLTPAQLGDAAAEKVHQVREVVSKAGDEASAHVKDVAERAGHVASEAADTARSKTKEKTHSATSQS
jgi:hypothetical protein